LRIGCRAAMIAAPVSDVTTTTSMCQIQWNEATEYNVKEPPEIMLLCLQYNPNGATDHNRIRPPAQPPATNQRFTYAEKARGWSAAHCSPGLKQRQLWATHYKRAPLSSRLRLL
jgi:hypothetical protein